MKNRIDNKVAEISYKENSARILGCPIEIRIKNGWKQCESTDSKIESFHNDMHLPKYIRGSNRGGLRISIHNTLNEIRLKKPILDIRFSLEHVYYGNSLNEFRDVDFLTIIKTIKSCLRDIGIHVTEKALMNAEVLEISYSKDIFLPKEISCKTVLKDICGVPDNSSIYTMIETFNMDYGKEVHSELEFADLNFFDRAAQIKCNERKFKGGRKLEQVEKDNQRAFLRENILRVETSIGHPEAIKQVLKKLKLDSTGKMTLKDLLCENVARKALSYFWRTVSKNMVDHTIDKLKESIIKSALGEDDTAKKVRELGFFCMLKSKDKAASKEISNVVRKNKELFYKLNERIDWMPFQKACKLANTITTSLNKFTPLSLATGQSVKNIEKRKIK